MLDDLFDLSDVVPTLADLAGVSLPTDLAIDGRSISPQLQGRRGNPRDWVFCQLKDEWFIRSRRWRLHHDGRLADMTDRYDPRFVSPDENKAAAKARKRLRAAARDLGIL